MSLPTQRPRTWWELTTDQQREWEQRERDYERQHFKLEEDLKHARDEALRAAAQADRDIRSLRSEVEALEEENSLLRAAQIADRRSLLDRAAILKS